MKKIIYLSLSLVILLSATCDKRIVQPIDCPHDFNCWSHNLSVPIEIEPHKRVYNIGDTIHIKTFFSDSIVDLCMLKTFKIEHFPFLPRALMYMYDDSLNQGHGFRENELIIDDNYEDKYIQSSRYADGFRAKTIYDPELEEYQFEFILIIKEVGDYVLIYTDMFNEHDGTGNNDLNEEANAVDFQGKCNAPIFISALIEGDDHIDYFEDLLIHLDTTVYRGNFTSVEDLDKPGGGTFGRGSLFWEYHGTYCFTVED